MLKEGSLLRIYVGESVQKDNLPMYEWLVRRAKQDGLHGTTVLRGIEGFGASGKIHVDGFFDVVTETPVIVEIVDDSDRIEKFASILDDVMVSGLATIQSVQILNKSAG
jgi:PII-like signaling protein